jgi:hypothetical protein
MEQIADSLARVADAVALEPGSRRCGVREHGGAEHIAQPALEACRAPAAVLHQALVDVGGREAVDDVGGLVGRQAGPQRPAGGQDRRNVAGTIPPTLLDVDPERRQLRVTQGGARPVVYGSLGTVPPFSQPALFAAILHGIEQHDVDVVVTIGEQNQVSSLGPQPANVHVERWLPLPLLLPRCTAAICHAGSGTTLAALGAGLPLLLLPQGADQFENAAVCARAGVARVLTPDAVSPESLSAELAMVLSEARYRQAARRVRDEIVAMLAPADVVPLLEDLLRENASNATAADAGQPARRTLTVQS